MRRSRRAPGNALDRLAIGAAWPEDAPGNAVRAEHLAAPAGGYAPAAPDRLAIAEHEEARLPVDLVRGKAEIGCFWHGSPFECEGDADDADCDQARLKHCQDARADGCAVHCSADEEADHEHGDRDIGRR